MIKFVVLSLHRSGTSLLCNMLDRHPDVLCHGEIFHSDGAQLNRAKAPGLTAEDIALRTSDPIAFVTRVYEECGRYQAVGFKMWQSQNRPACAHLMGSEDVYKIILQRNNVLARFASHHLALRTRVWGLSAKDDRRLDTSPLHAFDPAQFEVFLKAHAQVLGYYRSQVRGPHMLLTYEALARDGLANVLPFLGLRAVQINHVMRKLHTSNILDRFDAALHPVIIETLRQFRRVHMVQETGDLPHSARSTSLPARWVGEVAPPELVDQRPEHTAVAERSEL